MTQYYVARDGQREGPFEEDEVLQRIVSGALRPNDLCWRDGMKDWQPIATVFKQGQPLFLHIPIGRLIALSIISFSLYEAYWIYKNWRYVKDRDGLRIHPLLRGIFSVFNCHSLLRRIHEDDEARAVELPTFSPQTLATGWVALIIVSNLVSRVPGVAPTLIAAFIPSFLCLVPVQRYVNTVSERRSPGQPYYRWSSGHVVCLVVGSVVWALVLIGMTVAPEGA